MINHKALLTTSFVVILSLTIVNVAHTSMPKPSTPEFTAVVVANSIQVTIKNKPLTPYENGSSPGLYYMFRFKDHNTEEGFWDYDPVYFVLPSTYGGYYGASDSELTVISLSLEGHHFPSGQIDLQAITLVGNQYPTDIQNGTVYGFDGVTGSWSNTQTLIFNDDLFPLTESSFFQIAIGIGILAIFVVGFGVLVYFKKYRK